MGLRGQATIYFEDEGIRVEVDEMTGIPMSMIDRAGFMLAREVMASRQRKTRQHQKDEREAQLRQQQAELDLKPADQDTEGVEDAA